MTDTQHFTVSGMTCQHCVASVTDEVGEVPGVQHVSVDLATGGLDVSAETPISRDAVAQAVVEAGYTLV